MIGTAMQLLCGGAVLLVVSGATGEWSRLDPALMTARPVWALLYLTFAGTILGYTSYIWLLEVASPAMVSTYAYVNPVVAVALGSLFGGESLGARVLIAAAVIVAGVGMIVSGGKKPKAERRAEPGVNDGEPFEVTALERRDSAS